MFADAPTRTQTRRAAADVFRRGEFQHKLSWIARFFRWLGHFFHLRRGNLNLGGGAGAGFGLLLYLVLFVVIALLIWVIVKVIQNWVRTPKVKTVTDDEAEVDVPRTRTEWRTEAEAAERDGRWKDAIRARYRELVAELIERGVVPDVPGRTTGELRADIADRAPAAADDFSTATVLFELPWYADVATGSDENRRFHELAVAVLAAAPAESRRRVTVPA